MAPQEAPAAAVKEQPQPQPRPSSGSELTKENATAGITSNESLTVRRSMHLPSLFFPLSSLPLSPSSSLIKFRKYTKQEEEIERVVAPEAAVAEEERLRTEREVRKGFWWRRPQPRRRRSPFPSFDPLPPPRFPPPRSPTTHATTQ